LSETLRKLTNSIKEKKGGIIDLDLLNEETIPVDDLVIVKRENLLRMNALDDDGFREDAVKRMYEVWKICMKDQ